MMASSKCDIKMWPPFLDDLQSGSLVEFVNYHILKFCLNLNRLYIKQPINFYDWMLGRHGDTLVSTAASQHEALRYNSRWPPWPWAQEQQCEEDE